MRKFHLLVGLFGVIAFLASGQYMARVHDRLQGMDDAQRLLFRSTHIYLLLSSLLNLALGLHMTPIRGWRRWVRSLGSWLILLGPFLVGAGFFVEPWLSGLDRPYSRPGVIGCLVGMVLHLICWKPRVEPPFVQQPVDVQSSQLSLVEGR